MIKVDSKKRLSCNELLEHAVFKKRSQKYFPELFENDNYIQDPAQKSILLKTIKIPKNIMNLSNRLPQKNYESIETFTDSNLIRSVNSELRHNLV